MLKIKVETIEEGMAVEAEYRAKPNTKNVVLCSDMYVYYDLIGYDELVDKLIREQYSISQEFAILRQRDSKPEEFAAYNEYAEQCKARAREMLEEAV